MRGEERKGRPGSYRQRGKGGDAADGYWVEGAGQSVAKNVGGGRSGLDEGTKGAEVRRSKTLENSMVQEVGSSWR
jgi:hypothetical protein